MNRTTAVLSALCLAVGRFAAAESSGVDAISAPPEPLSLRAPVATPGLPSEGATLLIHPYPEHLAGQVARTFRFTLETAGDHFLAAHLEGTRNVPATPGAPDTLYPLQRITALLDGKPLGEVPVTGTGWQSSRIGERPVPLAAGEHTLSFVGEGMHFPQVDAVKLAPTAALAFFDEARNGRGSASNSSYSWEVTPYSLSSPLANHSHMMTVPVVYSFYRLIRLNQGQAVTFNTAPVAGNDYYSVDPVMYLFCSTDNTVAWSNDDDIGYQPRIAVTIPKTCDYYLVTRSYSSYWAGTTSGRQGLVNVYQNGALLQADAPISGYLASVGTSNEGTLNYFTAYSTGSPILFLATAGATSPLRFSGGRYWYLPPMDYNWFDDARFRVIKSGTGYMDLKLLVLAEGAWWIYYGNADVYGSVPSASGTPFGFFENLKASDAMKTADSSGTYNCASWAGGITSSWTWVGYDWWSWDWWFGNLTPRYTGAVTFTRDQASDSNAEVAMWSTNGDISGATHFSVRREGNHMPHGYDWESKPGSVERLYHPRDALAGHDYGAIFALYRDAAKDPYAPWGAARTGGAALTMEESLAHGLTVLPSVGLTAAEARTLAAQRQATAVDAKALDALYTAWAVRCGDGLLAVESRPEPFLALPEAAAFEAAARAHPAAARALLIDKLFAAQDEGMNTRLLAALLVRHEGEAQAAVVARAREDALHANYTPDGAYVAPSYIADVRRAAKRLLSRAPLAGDATPEDSHDLLRVSPNPMVDTARVELRLDAPAAATVELIDPDGNRIQRLTDGATLAAGAHALTLRRSVLRAGLYTVRLELEGRVLQRRVLIQ